MPIPDEPKAPSQLPKSTAASDTTTGDGGVDTGDLQRKEKPQEVDEPQYKKEESDDKPLGPDEDLPGKGNDSDDEGDGNNNPRGSDAVEILV